MIMRPPLPAALPSSAPGCAANMTTTAAGSGLAPQRASVEEAVATAEVARVQLHCAYVRQHAGTLEAAGGHSAGDFECQAWLHAVLLAVDEARLSWSQWQRVCRLAGWGCAVGTAA